jgi:uncharacterized damage-inducible protein DinB
VVFTMNETAMTPPQSTYVTDTLALLGDTEPIAVLSVTPAWLAARVEGLSLAALRQPESPGKWSLAQILAHLADTEIAYGWRARLILTADRPPIQGFDQGAWLARFHATPIDPADALRAFTALRQWNLPVWSMSSPADLQRGGVHAERGPETFDVVRRLAAGHDLRHRRQVERLLTVIR